MLRNMTSSYVLLELNGRTDYTYYASMAEAGCLRKAQTYQLMIDDNLNKSNLSLVWTSMNYESCFAFDDLENANLEERYEILNESGVSSIVWQSEGVFVFLATVIDPEYSFCNLSTMFAVYVTGLEKERKRLIPFLVLGTSVFGLFGVLFLLYVTTK
ncbi:cation channel sperm-associated protein subunit epsilon-like [Xenia sp. Carnegie-2017]|uniref:cation channel sperm-associated protein subunit epsilon-like n=1 Tax=Xenia sp. Carnegie-2017 TaxID=2897299 RepID=UPI001F050247|nr:cation channel sperm-associated protein subunit epsilon-like [Xenia sp. Carnegie-2017]